MAGQLWQGRFLRGKARQLWRVPAGRGLVGRGAAGEPWRRRVWPSRVWRGICGSLGVAWRGEARSGLARRGCRTQRLRLLPTWLASHGMVWWGRAGRGGARQAAQPSPRLGRRGKAGLGRVRHGSVWQAVRAFSPGQHLWQARHGWAGSGKARQGRRADAAGGARPGKARRGLVGLGRRGKAVIGMTQ
jgi:hypothetical protein